jgi:hypothetical protein
MATLPPVARNINVFCKKCGTDRYFKVITHTTSTTAKLKCEVCNCLRNYSLDEEKKVNVTDDSTAKPKAKKKSTKSSVAKVSAKATKAESQWNLMKEQYKGPQAVTYAISHKFNDRQSLEHPTFGLGFVTKAHAYKIEVVFSEGVKELLHDRK